MYLRYLFGLCFALILGFFLGACGQSKEGTVVSPTSTNTIILAPTPTLVASPAAPMAEENLPNPSEELETTEAYPPPVYTPTMRVEVDEGQAYPPPTSSIIAENGGYPPPNPTSTVETSRIPIVPFLIERPLLPGATVIRGTGPANVPILIVDASFMGEILAKTTIDPSGVFEVEVEPLVDKHWIGVALDNLDGTEFTRADFAAIGFRGPGAAQIPQVGFIYDSVVVGQ